MNRKGLRPDSGIFLTAKRAVLLPLFICLLTMLPAVKSTLAWIDLKCSDLFFVYSPVLRHFTGLPELPRHPVVIVNKDQTFFQRFQRDPDREDFAALTRLLHNHGAKVMAYDFIFNEPGDSNRDKAFAAALGSFSLPILATHFVGRGTQTFEKIDLTDFNAARPPWPTPAHDLLRSHAAGTALINLAADYDSTIRFAPLAFHPTEMEDFLPSLGYAAYIAALIASESPAILEIAAKNSSGDSASLMPAIMNAGKYIFASSGHRDLDKMTRRLELTFIARLLAQQYPQMKEQLQQHAKSADISSLPHKTWLNLPTTPLPLIGSYHMPCLRLPFSKLSPPFRGDGIQTMSLGTLLETEADRTSSHLHSKQLINISGTEDNQLLTIALPLQTVGSHTVTGRILDQNQQPVANAEVLLLMPDIGFWSDCKTQTDGSFSIKDLPRADFSLHVTSNSPDGWQKASMRGSFAENQHSTMVPDLIFPTTSARLHLNLPADQPEIAKIAIFGEPMPMIRSDNEGKTSLKDLPANHIVAALDEDTELEFVDSRLRFTDGRSAPQQTAALLGEDSPWVSRFLYTCKPDHKERNLILTGLPTSLDARLAIFSRHAGSKKQITADLTLLPETANTVASIPTATQQSEKFVTARFACSSNNITIKLLGENGETFNSSSNHSLQIPAGRYLILTGSGQQRGIVKPDLLQSPVVFFGSALPQDQDFIVTPINFMDQSYNRVPGVNLHATLFSALMRQSYLKAVKIHSDRSHELWPILQTLVLLPVLALLNIIFVKYGAIWGGICVMLTTLIWLTTGLALFLHQWLLPIFFPILQLLSFGGLRGYMSWAIARQQERETRQTFGRFISPAVVEDILRTPDSLKPGGEKKELSVIFTDLAGFTTISEKLEPEQLTELMNEYLDEMTKILFQFGGTLDKYIGDAIMGFWNHPKAQPDHAQRSVDCAIHMQKRLAILRDRWVKQGLPKVEVRAGINSAVCMVGFIGSEIQMNFTCLGDGVNLASRLEGANKAYGTFIMIAESVHRQIDRNIISTRFLDFLAVKGKEKPMEVFEVRGYRRDEPENWIEAEILYKAGISFYLARQWDEATAAFTAVARLLPEDGPSAVYIERCHEFKKLPPPENWDGRYILKSK